MVQNSMDDFHGYTAQIQNEMAGSPADDFSVSSSLPQFWQISLRYLVHFSSLLSFIHIYIYIHIHIFALEENWDDMNRCPNATYSENVLLCDRFFKKQSLLLKIISFMLSPKECYPKDILLTHRDICSHNIISYMLLLIEESLKSYSLANENLTRNVLLYEMRTVCQRYSPVL